MKWLLWGTRKLEQAIRRSRKAAALGRRKLGNYGAYQAFDVASALQACDSQPLCSIVVPVLRADLARLRRCIDSVCRQIYSNWELLLVDCSEEPSLASELEKWTTRDERIRIFKQAKSPGVAVATNFGIAQSGGMFVGFLNQDDELAPDALLWVVVMHNRDPRSRWFYSDEAALDADGNHAGRFLCKPAFSWEYLLSGMFTRHFSVYDRRLLEAVGGMREQFEDAQNHDLALRISERVESGEVTHIPQVLYFSRENPASAPGSGNPRRAAARAAYKAVVEAAQRRRLICRVVPDLDDSARFQLYLQPQTAPKVSIIIPTRNAAAMLIRCIESLKLSTNYPNYEIVVIDNQSDDPELARYLSRLESSGRGRVIAYDQPFNHSDMHNKAIAEIDSELIVFLNNDVYGFNQGWLEQFVATIETEDSIAAVGAKLFYPDGTIQHAGVVIGSYGNLAGHIDYKQPGHSPGYCGRSRALQQVSGVTAALMIMRRSAFDAVGGFDGARYPTSYNDVDLCVRLNEAGYRCLFNPAVHAIHQEAQTRTVSPDEGEFRRRLQEDLQRRQWRDRFWNLSLFEDRELLYEHQRTWDWIPEKLRMLQAEVAKLAAQPTAASLENLAALLSRDIPDGAYSARILLSEAEPATGEPKAAPTAPPMSPNLGQQFPSSTSDSFHPA